ncbi:MAG: MBL fold metallo-hydrolase [Dehalococcoidia bacterium]|nr:MBL fold metallo-hydrolase [Dehalococcoidia bacterium]
MLLKTLVVGPLSTNCYLLASQRAKEALVVDPGAEGERIVQELAALGLRATVLVSTHGHFDHTGAVGAVQARISEQAETPPAFAIHEADAPALSRGSALQLAYPGYQEPPKPDRLLSADDVLEVGELQVQVLETPGHTPGSICLYLASASGSLVFTGDTLFQMSIGRTDFAGGDQRQELASIASRLLVLPDETRVFPGHGPATTIGDERRWNPFLRSLRV